MKSGIGGKDGRAISSQRWSRQKSAQLSQTDFACFSEKLELTLDKSYSFQDTACSSYKQIKSRFMHQSRTTKTTREKHFQHILLGLLMCVHRSSCICVCSQRKVLQELIQVSECIEACKGNALPL